MKTSGLVTVGLGLLILVVGGMIMNRNGVDSGGE